MLIIADTEPEHSVLQTPERCYLNGTFQASRIAASTSSTRNGRNGDRACLSGVTLKLPFAAKLLCHSSLHSASSGKNFQSAKLFIVRQWIPQDRSRNSWYCFIFSAPALTREEVLNNLPKHFLPFQKQHEPFCSQRCLIFCDRFSGRWRRRRFVRCRIFLGPNACLSRSAKLIYARRSQ